MSLNDDSEWNNKGCLYELLMRNDQLRKDCFEEMGLIPKVLIVKKDLNFTCTIERALKFKSYKSAKIILQTILEVINTFEYQKYISNDLPVILNAR